MLLVFDHGSSGYSKHYELDIEFVVVPDINGEDLLIWSRIDPFPLEQVDFGTVYSLKRMDVSVVVRGAIDGWDIEPSDIVLKAQREDRARTVFIVYYIIAARKAIGPLAISGGLYAIAASQMSGVEEDER